MAIKPRPWWALAVAIVVAGGWLLRPKPEPPPELTAVKYGDVEQTVLADGIVDPLRKVDVGARLTAQILRIHVKLGDHVSRGQLLVTLDSSQTNADLGAAQAALANAEADAAARQTALADAHDELQRQQAMAASQASTGQELRKAISGEHTSEAQLNAANALIVQRRAEVVRSRLVDSESQIRAPIDGDVVSIPVQEGQTVNSAQTAPTLLTIAVLDPVTIKAKISESDVGNIHAGQHVTFSSVGDPERRRPGEVRLLQALPEKVGETPMYDALIDVANTDRSLLPDMHVNVRFEVASVKHVLMLPTTALGKKNASGQFEVKVAPTAKAGAAQFQTHQVRTGISDGGNVQILSGVREGDLAVITPPAKP